MKSILKNASDFARSAKAKATTGLALATVSGLSVAQTEEPAGGNEAAIQTAIDGGMSMVQMAAAGVIGIAAICMGLYVVVRMIGR